MPRLPREEMSALTANIAVSLGDGWSGVVDDYAWSATLSGPDGAAVWLSPGDDGAKLEIHGNYPDNDAYDVKHVRIGVSVSRGAATIAREITRRVLPEYLTELSRIQAHIADRAAMKAKRRAFADELAEPIGARVEETDRTNDTRVTVWNGIRVTINLDYRAESGHVEIHQATPDQMRTIVALLAS